MFHLKCFKDNFNRFFPLFINNNIIIGQESNVSSNYQVTFSANNNGGYNRQYIDTDNAHFNYNPSTNHLHGFAEITATKFDGALEGNADTATWADTVDVNDSNANSN